MLCDVFSACKVYIIHVTVVWDPQPQENLTTEEKEAWRGAGVKGAGR